MHKYLFRTDYPIPEYGDKEGFRAPIRNVVIRSYDGDKYVSVFVQDIDDVKRWIVVAMKAGYVINKHTGRQPTKRTLNKYFKG